MKAVSLAAAAAVAVLALATGASARSNALHLVRIAQFDAPVYATTAPGEPGNLYVAEQTGYIRVLSGGTIRPTVFLDVHSQIVSGGEQGLLSGGVRPGGTRRRTASSSTTPTATATRTSSSTARTARRCRSRRRPSSDCS